MLFVSKLRHFSILAQFSGTEALLIDTGFGSGDLKELVSSLVSGEITVINTHCHGDHSSGRRGSTGKIPRVCRSKAYG